VKICIIGGGPTGLTAAYELSKKGHQVSLYERETEQGGLVGTLWVGDQRLEKFYHHLFVSDREIIDLIHELTLSSKLLWLTPKNGIYLNQRLYPFTSPIDLIHFKELSPLGRIFLGLLFFKANWVRKWENLDEITAKEWIRQQGGVEIYEKFWRPLLNSKFDTDSDRISAAWLWNKIHLRGSSRKKALSAEVLGYMEGSFGTLYEKMVCRIKEYGGILYCSKEVKQVHPKEDHSLDVVTQKGGENYNAVIATLPPAELLSMSLPLPQSYIEQIRQIKYKANLCLLLELSKPLSSFYWISVAEEGFPFVGVIEHTNLVPAQAYRSHVVYLSRYLDENHELYQARDEKIQSLFLNYLKKMFPHWNPSTTLKTHLFRARHAQPVIFKGYSKIVPEYETPVDNFYLASMAQIFPEDRGQNYAIKMGREIAHLIMDRA
jgi:protoporphyrinogen oxidase